MLSVRKASPSDFALVMDIYKIARDFMAKTGNPNQWKNSRPTKEQIGEDIENGICHVIFDKEGIHGVFALCEGVDSTYLYIEDGAWLDDAPYVTIHRIASDQKVHGILKCAMDYCQQYADSIRIDTHNKNAVMQHVLLKNGFKKCGIIYLKTGEPRIAFQWKK